MTQEDKELLLKDLSARLPYGVIALTEEGKGHICDINLTMFGTEIGVNTNPCIRDAFVIENIKPYLFPLSSMTEEQKKEMNSFDPFQTEETKTLGQWAYHLVDFYNKYHFDYRGLIEKSLALDATGLNIY